MLTPDVSHDADRPVPASAALRDARAILARTRLHLLEADTRLHDADLHDLAPVLAWFSRFGRRYPRVAQLLMRGGKFLAWAATGRLGRYLRADRRRRGQQRAQRTGADVAAAATAPRPAASPVAGGGRMLIVEHSVPKPDQSAGARYTLSMIRALREMGWSITMWTYERTHGGRYSEDLEALGVCVLDARWPRSFAQWLEDNGEALDHVMMLWPRVTRDLLPEVLRGTPARISYHGIDLHFARIALQAARLDDPFMEQESAQYLAMERQIWRAVDVSVYLSQEEADEVLRLEPAVAACGISPYAFTEFHVPSHPPATSNILFVGSFGHPPNGDAVHWFAAEILPLIRSRHPHARFVVVGSNPPPDIRALAGPHIDVLGQIDDAALERAYAAARVAVAPLRFGAGVKGKVVEALTKGMPIVTTPIGVQGLVGVDAFVPCSSDPAEMAEAVSRLLAEDAAWLQQSRAQSAHARRYYSLEAMKMSLGKVL